MAEMKHWGPQVTGVQRSGLEFRVSERGQKFELGLRKEDGVIISTLRTQKGVLVGVWRRYHFTPVRWAKNKNNKNTHCWAGCCEKITFVLLMEIRIVRVFLGSNLTIFMLFENIYLVHPVIAPMGFSQK